MRIDLRAVEPEDLELIFQWENDRTVWPVSNTIEPFSRFTIKNYIENTTHDIYQSRQLRLMIDLIEANNTVSTIGSVDLFEFDPHHLRAGIGILIGISHERGKGYASKALDELIAYSRDVLLLHQLFCNISIDNEPSIHLFTSKGFQISGTKKDWLKTSTGYKDEYILQLIF